MAIENLLKTSFLGLDLQSPIMVASGPATHDVNQLLMAEERNVGGVFLKSVCSDKFEHMRSWPRPRYKLLDWDKQIEGRSKTFTLYSYEQGYSGTLDDYWNFIRSGKDRVKVPIVASIFADDVNDWVEMAKKVEESGADAVELDISSPHRPGTMEFDDAFKKTISSVVKGVKIPVLVKLAPSEDLVVHCMKAEEAGASCVTLCNRIRGFDVDIESQRPILHGYYAGVGGPWTKYYTMRYVAEAAQKIKIPISASSGTMTGEDAIKYILLGATTVQILSVILVNGWDSITRIQEEIKEYMKRKDIASLESIRGKALEVMTDPDEIIRWSGESKQGPRNVYRQR